MSFFTGNSRRSITTLEFPSFLRELCLRWSGLPGKAHGECGANVQSTNMAKVDKKNVALREQQWAVRFLSFKFMMLRKDDE